MISSGAASAERDPALLLSLRRADGICSFGGFADVGHEVVRELKSLRENSVQVPPGQSLKESRGFSAALKALRHPKPGFSADCEAQGYTALTSSFVAKR